MKLPITEKFLWEIYDLFSAVGNLELTDSFLNPHAVKRSLMGGKRHFDAMYEEIYRKYRKRYGRIKFSKFIYYLKKKAYIEAKAWEKRGGVMLTQKGVDKILRSREATSRLKKRGDKRWQMVVFDIPEKYRGQRDIFRHKLKFLGYRQLQRSIWVSPYDVVKNTKEIITGLNLEDEAKLFIIDSIREVELKEKNKI